MKWTSSAGVRASARRLTFFLVHGKSMAIAVHPYHGPIIVSGVR